MSRICLHLIISGRVQGVWFRRFTQQHAQANGVAGWVRNLRDGSVEALLCGEERAVRHVEAWLNRGPDLAHVTRVEAQEVPVQSIEEFAILEHTP